MVGLTKASGGGAQALAHARVCCHHISRRFASVPLLGRPLRPHQSLNNLQKVRPIRRHRPRISRPARSRSRRHSRRRLSQASEPSLRNQERKDGSRRSGKSLKSMHQR